jgi:hypothetical protein
MSRRFSAPASSDGGSARVSAAGGARASVLLACQTESSEGVLQTEGEAERYVRGLKKPMATIKLDKYNGSTPLETHFAKPENCAEYYGWIERDRKTGNELCTSGGSGIRSRMPPETVTCCSRQLRSAGCRRTGFTRSSFRVIDLRLPAEGCT